MATLMPGGKQSYFDNAGDPLAGGLLYTYAAGTSTPLATYSDKAGTIPNANPVVLDARGEATVFWGAANYKVALRTALDVPVWTQDDVDPTAIVSGYAPLASPAFTGTPTGLGPATVTATGSTTARSLAVRFADVVNVKDFGAKGDGVTDDTAAIQAAANAAAAAGIGVVSAPGGTFAVSSPILLKNNVRLVGAGPGDYTAGAGVQRITVIQPTSGFSGTSVVKIDAANNGAGAYVLGAAVHDLTIDMVNIPTSSTYGLEIRSLTNPETFRNLRIINSDRTALFIGVSANGGALQSDGLTFDNLYTLSKNIDPSTTAPIANIESSNEMKFRDSKFTRRSNIGPGTPAPVGSVGVYVVARATGFTTNAVTFDGCSFAGVETGLKVEALTGAGQAPRWIRNLNGTFEGVKYGMWLKGVASRPVQFATLGPGNRFQAMADSGAGVLLDDYATNNTVIVDEYAPTAGGYTVSGTALATDNLVIGQPGGMILLGSNAVFGRRANGGVLIGAGQDAALALDINTAAGTSNPQINLQRGGVTKATLYVSDAFAGGELLLGVGTALYRFSAGGAIILGGPISPGTPAGGTQTGSVFQGSGVPSNANGSNGDVYFRTDTPGTVNQRIYVKSAGSWVGIL